jgi:isopentenyl diphosphate isomerase/L-lactate dehydrogenase-like FMN-dependent dehydrogenase
MIIANIDDFRKQCEARLPRFLYDIITGGSFQENTLRANIIERSVSAGSKVSVFTVDLATPGRRYSEVHDGMEKDSTLLGMLTSTIRALPKVVDAVQGRVPVFMDGGIRSGLDVLKALALGTKACFVGRAWAYALGAAGESGVRDMLDILREEFRGRHDSDRM